MTRTHIRWLGLILLGLFSVGQITYGQSSDGWSRRSVAPVGGGRIMPAIERSSFASRSTSITDGLISHWTGDGNALDAVGGNDGAMLNGAAFATGVFGSAFHFDGVDDLMQAPTNGLPTGGSDRTVAMWVRIDDSVTAESFFGGYGNFGELTHAYLLGAAGDKSTSFFSQWGASIEGPNLDNARWYHIAATTADGNTTLYIDGNPWNSAFLTIDTSADSQFLLGKLIGPDGTFRRLRGSIDDVRVYDRALSGSEILALINARPVFGCSVNKRGLQDGGLEHTTDLGLNSFWSSFSTQFGSSLCTLDSCGDGLGTGGPRTGNAWIWFDGTENGTDAETARASQSVIIPASGAASLLYYLRVGFVTEPITSVLSVYIDGNLVDSVVEPAVADEAYYARSVDISAYADGRVHLITFAYFRPAGTTDSDNFTIDDISIIDSCPTRSAQRYFDYDGDGKTDESVVRPSDNVWYLNLSRAGFKGTQFGFAGDLLAPADYTGDGKTDIAIYRGGTGGWYMLKSEDNTFFGIEFGANGDIPAPGDFDADGRADFVVFRPFTGTWYLLRSTAGFAATQFGLSGDVPAVGDFDGDGRADISVFRPSEGVWFRLNSFNGLFFAAQFGTAGDKVVQADYTGDGRTDIAVWRPSDGTWYILRSEDGSYYGVQFGAAGDLPVPGDYDGDGMADPAVFRPTDGVWYEQRSTSGFTALQFGTNGDKPTPNAFVN